MILGALRSVIRPVSRSILCSRAAATALFPATKSVISPSPVPDIGLFFYPLHRNISCLPTSHAFNILTDTRYPKRRPSAKRRRKRASMKPPGPYAFVKYVPGQPILPNNPNEGSVKGRKAKKRIRQRKEFILAEKKKRKAQFQEARRKKNIKRVERKMAAVARERAWAERLAELKQLEKEKNNASMA